MQPEQVDSAFNILATSSEIVFDMRGYPRGTAWSIAPRLAPHDGIPITRRYRPLVFSPDTAMMLVEEAVDSIPPLEDGMRYAGRTVMLIDERTVSQAEYTGMMFEAANGTVFIGSATSGANGDIPILYCRVAWSSG